MRVPVLLLISCFLACAADAQSQVGAGKLRVSSVPEGCTVLLDNRPAGTTPLLLDSVQEGAHVVVVRKEGFCTVVDTLLTEAGNLKEHGVTLEPECVLSVESEPADAAVYLNGVFQGKTPVRIGQLRGGNYGVMITRRDYQHWTDSVRLAAAAPIRLRASLRAYPATVSIFAPDSSVEVFVNGMSLGYGTRQNVTAPAGYVSVKAYHKITGETVEGQCYMLPGTTQAFKADFDRPSHSAFWYSMFLPGLGQYLNGARVKGVGIGAGFLAALSYAVVRQREFTSRDADLANAQQKYDAAFWAGEALKQRSSLLSASDEAHASARARNIGVGIALGLYVANLVDAWFFHDTVTEIVTTDQIEPTIFSSGAASSSHGIVVTMRVPL